MNETLERIATIQQVDVGGHRRVRVRQNGREVANLLAETGAANPIAAEVGVHQATTSTFLLEVFPALYLWMIDPWTLYPAYEPWTEGETQADWDDIAERVERVTHRYSRRRAIIRLPSVEAAKMIADGSLDLVYIDACHTEEHVAADIRAWWPKVRDGGVLCGDDYYRRAVRKAANQWSNQIGVQVALCSRNRVFSCWKKEPFCGKGGLGR